MNKAATQNIEPIIPIINWRICCGFILVSLLSVLQVAATDKPISWSDTLKLGGSVQGRIKGDEKIQPGYGPARKYEWRSTESGPVTILLDSYDFDAVLIVTSEASDLHLKDDDTGIETNAMLVLNAESDTQYTIVAATKTDMGGEFSLHLLPGKDAGVKDTPFSNEAIAFRAKALERALARDDLDAAAKHQYLKGWYHFNRSEYDLAETSYLSSLELAKNINNIAYQATSHHGLARIYLFRHTPQRGREHAEKAFALFHKLGFEKDEGWARYLIGYILVEEEKYPEARDHLEKALRIFRKFNVSAGEAWSLNDLGRIDLNTVNCHEAEKNLQRAASLFNKLNILFGEAWAIENLALVYEKLGDITKSMEFHERALDKFRAIKDKHGEASTIGNFGNLFFYLGEYSKARSCYEQKLVLAKQLGLVKDQVAALGNIGLIYHAAGDYSKALESYQQALALGSPPPNLLGNIAQLYVNLHDYRKARKYIEDQLVLARQYGNINEESVALLCLGEIYRELKFYRKALQCFETALRISRQTGNKIQEARVLYYISIMHCRMEEYDRAEKYAVLSFQLAQETGLEHIKVAYCSVMCMICQERNELERALSYIEKSQDFLKEYSHSYSETINLYNTGYIHFLIGNLEKAKDYAKASLAIREKEGLGIDNLQPLELLSNIAIREEDVSTAAAYLERASIHFENPYAGSLNSEDASRLRSRYSDWGDIAQDLTALLIRKANSDRKAISKAVSDGYGHACFWKGRSLLEGIIQHFQGGRSADVIQVRRDRKEKLAHREEVLKRLSTAIRQKKPLEEINNLRNESNLLLEQAKSISLVLEDTSPRDASLEAPRRYKPDAVRQALIDKNTVLIEYANGSDLLFAYVITKDNIRFLQLGNLEEIESSVENYLSIITNASRLASVKTIAEAGYDLYKKLLNPLVKEIGKEATRLVIVPSAFLAGVPFEALVSSIKNDVTQVKSFSEVEFVIDRYEISYGPSSPVLVELASVGPRQKEGRVLVMADPWYPNEPEDEQETVDSNVSPILAARYTAPEEFQFFRLKQTRREALALGRLLFKIEQANPETALNLVKIADQRSGSMSAKWFDLHLGQEASRERLSGNLRTYAILHLAAHGYVDREFPNRTGLALAFADDGEGFFTISDVLDLDLDANLVVLSACDTARGEIREGEGVQSLARSFMYAGSRAVVASLWQVADWEAAETFEAFYQELLEQKQPPAAALRKAKLEVRRSKALRSVKQLDPGERSLPSIEAGHPFFWAPFIYIGLPQ